MDKKELLAMSGKGKITFGSAEIEVTTSTVLNSDFISIRQHPINDFTFCHDFAGGFVEYITDDDCLKLPDAIEKVHQKMLEQEEVTKRKPIEFVLALPGGIKRVKSKLKYEVQRIDTDGYVKILTVTNGEADLPINCPIKINGKLFMPIWSFYLDCAVYKWGGLINE